MDANAKKDGVLQRLKAPDWVITNPTILGAMNVLAVAPVGFAGYLVDEGSSGKLGYHFSYWGWQ